MCLKGLLLVGGLYLLLRSLILPYFLLSTIIPLNQHLFLNSIKLFILFIRNVLFFKLNIVSNILWQFRVLLNNLNWWIILFWLMLKDLLVFLLIWLQMFRSLSDYLRLLRLNHRLRFVWLFLELFFILND